MLARDRQGTGLDRHADHEDVRALRLAEGRRRHRFGVGPVLGADPAKRSEPLGHHCGRRHGVIRVTDHVAGGRGGGRAHDHRLRPDDVEALR
ncbi:MAG: hypothetical protein R2705_02900 [Ilumatobacteraceae bacterium]